MSNDTVVSLAAPARVSDPLTELLRTGAPVNVIVSRGFHNRLKCRVFLLDRLCDAYTRR